MLRQDGQVKGVQCQRHYHLEEWMLAGSGVQDSKQGLRKFSEWIGQFLAFAIVVFATVLAKIAVRIVAIVVNIRHGVGPNATAI